MYIQVLLPQEIKAQIVEHLKTNSNQEIGGVLLGYKAPQDQYLVVNITGFLPAQFTENFLNEFHYNHQVWRQIYENKKTKFPQEDILGWYHSKLNGNLTTTHVDYNIHKLFFNEPEQIMFLIDPKDPEKACFFQWEKDFLVPLLENDTPKEELPGIKPELKQVLDEVQYLQSTISDTLVKQKQWLDEENERLVAEQNLTSWQKLMRLPLGLKILGGLGLTLTLVMLIMYPVMRPIATPESSGTSEQGASEPLPPKEEVATTKVPETIENPKEINEIPQETIESPQETTTTEYTLYTVKPGDSLWNIAQKHYNNGFEFYRIIKYNAITNPSSIEVGQQLKLPNKD